MRIPPSAEISVEKLTHYLLAYRPKNDKSGFLAQAGFDRRQAGILEQAIRKMIAENGAVADRWNEYGTFFRVTGRLQGPNGSLDVVTIWLKRANDGSFRFITLKPLR